MFKGILPSKRVTSSDFTMITPLGDANVNLSDHQQAPSTTKNGKPSTSTGKGFPPATQKRKRANTRNEKKESDADGLKMEQAFDKLLDDLQIPSTLRPKLIGMDSTVKAAMVKSSHVLTLPKCEVEPPTTPRSVGLRRARSTESVGSPFRLALDYDFQPPVAPFMAEHVSSHHEPTSGTPRKASGHFRGISIDSPGSKSRSQIHLPMMSQSTLDLTSFSKTTKDKGSTIASKNGITPTKMISILSSTSSTQIDIEPLKKLRLLLRNESASWTQAFLNQSGYSALLTRLNEILEVEWREEQHDDQVLHELLRCFKALSTSSIGCTALRSSFPTPYAQLMSLLYSDKKPGEIATRRLIVELISVLFELYPPSALPSCGSPNRSRARREAWESDSLTNSNLINLPPPYKNFYSLIRKLLLTTPPPAAEAPEAPVSPHEFIESLHRPRVYKTYLQELSDICRDYFWVFCHQNNTVWILSEVDETRVEKPRAPGGMTGGVEFEAMGYFTTHLKFINAVATCVADLNMPKDNELSAYNFHCDLFLSGLERIILIARKASTTYYPTLHLELSRYIAHVGRTGYEIPWTVSRLTGPPPSSMCKNPPASGCNTPAGSPMKRSTQPPLLANRRLD